MVCVCLCVFILIYIFLLISPSIANFVVMMNIINFRSMPYTIIIGIYVKYALIITNNFLLDIHFSDHFYLIFSNLCFLFKLPK